MDFKINVQISVAGVKDYMTYGSRTINMAIVDDPDSEQLILALTGRIWSAMREIGIVSLDEYNASKEEEV